MTLPSFSAEQSLYRSSRHYRASALAGAVGGIRPSANLPHGSYQYSCFDCCSNGSDLFCVCYDEYGGPILTSLWEHGLSISDCQGCDIYNNNGELGCCYAQVTVLASSRRYKQDIRDMVEEAGEAQERLAWSPCATGRRRRDARPT